MSAPERVATKSPIAPALSRTEANTLISAAGMAPSVLNTQPWAFDVHDSTIDVYADPSRGLYWSVDPRGRQLVISCGAALLNLRVAAAHLGRPAAVQLRPSPADPLLLASVTLGRRGERDRTNPADALLFAAIRHRHTHRGPFAPRTVPGAVLFELAECVHHEHANIAPISRSQRRWLFDLVAFADIALGQSPGYEPDLLKWTAGSTSREDGIPVSAFGSLSPSGLPPMRDFGALHGMTGRQERFAPDPWIAILATPRDDTEAWLQAGQALERLLLTARLRGLAASFLNQPLDEPEIRHDLVSPALGGYPQMILRLGYAAGDVATPRRRIDDVWLAHR